MTIEELEQISFLEREIEIELDRLRQLRESADVHSPSLSGMPKPSGVHDKIGDIVPDIVDLESMIIKHIRQCQEKRMQMVNYIHSIKTSRIRLIMTLRFIDQLSWQAVADAIGGRETEGTVRMACYRYLKSEAKLSQ